MNPHIQARNLSVQYADRPVLRDVSFAVAPGEFLAIVGRSGSGKSTLLHALAKLIPYEGTVDIPYDVGMVFQKYSVFPWMTVRENIAFGLREIEQSKVADYVRLVELEGMENRYPTEISGGQVQRVALARALAHSPDVLLMDEPYASLDAYTREKMQQWLLNIWEQHKTTIIFVTHDIEEAIFLSDRIVMLAAGNLTQEFTVEFPRPCTREIKNTQKFVELKNKVFERLDASEAAS